MDEYEKFAQAVMAEHDRTGWRVGQTTFNILPDGAANAVASKMFDPFHKRDWHRIDVITWAQEHLVFDGDNIIGVISKNEVLWEGTPTHHPTN